MNVRVGIIGTGFGSQVQIPAFRSITRAEVVAVASKTPGKAAQVAARFRIPQAFDDWHDLMRADLDLVSITSPPVTHHPMTLATLATEKHVLCEKPMAMNTREAEAMLAAAERAGVVHAIDHQLRFNPNRRKIKTLIEEGFVGRPRHALITVIGPGRSNPNDPWTWWSDSGQGGGLLGAQACHQIDLLRYWFGEISAASGTVETFIRQRPADGGVRAVTSEDFATFALRFGSGAVATVTLSVVAAHREGPRIEIWGDEGTLRLDMEERLWGARRGSAWTELTAPETLSAPPGMDYPALWGLSFVRLARHLVDAILDGSPLDPIATFADGVAIQRALDAIRG